MAKNKQHNKPSHIKSILAIDPGMTSMGWAYAHTNLDNGEFLVYDYGIIKPAALANKEKAYRGIFEDRILRVDIVEREYSKLVEKFKADYHVSESAFFHFRSPDAYASLSICIYTLSAVLFKSYKNEVTALGEDITSAQYAQLQQQYTLRRFAPKQIKKSVSADGTSDKDKIQLSILDNKQIKFVTPPDRMLIEHEADAIGAAYTFAQILPTQLLNMV